MVLYYTEITGPIVTGLIDVSGGSGGAGGNGFGTGAFGGKGGSAGNAGSVLIYEVLNDAGVNYIGPNNIIYTEAASGTTSTTTNGGAPGQPQEFQVNL